MSTDRDTTRIVRSWLRTDENDSADRVLGAVLDRLDTTPQRRAGWPAWRIPEMNLIAKFGLAAAVVAIAAVLGFNYLVAPNIGAMGLFDSAPSISPSPTLPPSPSPTPQPLGNASLDPGPVIATGFGASDSVTLRFVVPEGWVGFSGVGVLPPGGTEGPDGMGIGFGDVWTGLFADPCRWAADAPQIPVGPTVEDLANALAAQTAYEASDPIEVSLGGYSGQRVDLQLPSDVESCDNGEFYPWVGSLYAQGPDNRWDVWMLDVEGDRIVVLATHFPGTSAEDLAEQQAIIDSLVIEP